MELKSIAAGLAGGLFVLLLVVARAFWTAHARSKRGDSVVLSRRISSVNPFGSGRDFRVFSLIVLCGSIGSVGLMAMGAISREAGLAIFIGAFAGSLATMICVLPVKCVIRKEDKGRFVTRLKELGYALTDDGQDDQLYLPGSPRWQRWDSNRVSVSLRASRVEAICPLLIIGRL